MLADTVVPGLVSNRIFDRARKPVARLEICEGGLIVKRRSLSPVAPPVGCLRGQISGFSVESRGRLLRRLLALSWSDLINGKHSDTVRGLFVTLTYPDVFPDAFERWKRDLHTFSKRLYRKYPEMSALWKMEMKARKSGKNKGEIAPHFHLLVYTEKGVNIAEFRAWLSMAWYEVVGSGDAKHYRAGTQAKRIYGTVEKLMAYCSKYLGKDFDYEKPTGRVWGEFGELPRSPVYSVDIDYTEFSRRVRRWGWASSYLASRSVNVSGYMVFGKCAELTRGIVVQEGKSDNRLNSERAADLLWLRLLNYRIEKRRMEIQNKIYDERDRLIFG